MVMFCGWFVQSLPWLSSAVPGVALGALSALVSLCSSPADLPGILQSQSSRNSVPGNRAAPPGCPAALSSPAALLAWAFLRLSELSGLLEAQFMMMLLGRRCPKLLGLVLPGIAQTGVPHALTGLILCLPRDEVLVPTAESRFSNPSRFLYKKTHSCCSLNPVDIMEESYYNSQFYYAVYG